MYISESLSSLSLGNKWTVAQNKLYQDYHLKKVVLICFARDHAECRFRSKQKKTLFCRHESSAEKTIFIQLNHIAECQMAELRELLETCQFSQWLSIKGYFASNRQWGEFTKNYIYTLRKKEEQVMKKHILMIEKFCAVWIKNIHGIKYWLWMFWLEWLNV